MVLRDTLKAGIISQIYLAEGVNGSMEAKVLGQGVEAGSRVRVDKGGRFGGEAKWRASRSIRKSENG